MNILEIQPGVYSVIDGPHSLEVYACENEFVIEGVTFRYEPEDRRKWKHSGSASGTQGGSTLTASMPGKIVRILVAVGDTVEAGQGILVVEAMKMQNELKAARAGKVTAILVKPNDSVNAGATLVTIE